MQERKVTQAWLAQEFQVSQAAVSKWLKGTVPSGETLVRLAHFFRVTPESMVGMESCRQPEVKRPGETLVAQGIESRSKGHSRTGFDAEIDAFFDRLKSRVKADLSRCPPKEFAARLKLLEDLFGSEDLPSANRK